MGLTLVIGNKNYSSWSLRPWIALRTAGIGFEEIVIPLYGPDSNQRLLVHSSAGKVPILIDGEVRVWESLAILEYVAEKYPAAQLWPGDAAARAHARAISAEMHAGFAALRARCSMNFRRPIRPCDIGRDAEADVARIVDMWTDCRSRFGRGGRFLFGQFSAADAMYAPIALRFHTYAIDVGPVCRAYMDALAELPAWREWGAAATKEEWVLPQFEVA